MLLITFLPRSKRPLISWLQSPSTEILEPKKIKVCYCFHFPLFSHLFATVSTLPPSIRRNNELDKAQAGIKTARRNINNLRYADDTTLMAESEEELKCLLMREKENDKVDLKLNIKKTNIMAAVTDFILGGLKITVDGDFSHEIKRCLLLGRKAMTNLDSRSQSRDTTLLTKVCVVKAVVFQYSCKDARVGA